MQKAYVYNGIKDGNEMKGMVYASDKLDAFTMIKRMGIQKASVKLEPGYTLSAMLEGEDFNEKELARFYKVIGKRIKSGKSIIDGLESAADFIRKDMRLRSAIVTMRQFIQDGTSESEAMKRSGFPQRDCLVIQATQVAGRSGDAFISLAYELEQKIKLDSSISAVFRMPIILLGVMYLFLYGAMTKIAPKTQEFLKGTGLKVQLSPFIEGYFAFSNLMVEFILITNIVMIAIPIGLFIATKAGIFRRMLDKIKVMKEISVKADNASLWGAYSMMYEAGMQVRETCKMLSNAANRTDSKESFHQLGVFVNQGLEPHKAIEKVGFPEFVVNGYKSAHASGNLSQGLEELSKGLYDDVNSLTEILSENMKLISILMLSVGVGGIFFVTYYPVVSSVLSNV